MTPCYPLLVGCRYMRSLRSLPQAHPGTILTLNKSVIVASLRSPFNTRKPLVLDDFVHRDSISVEVVKVFFQSFRFAVVVHVRSAIVFGVAAFDVATVATVGAVVYRFAFRLCGGGGGGFGGLVGVLGGVGGFVEFLALAAFVGVGACGFGALGVLGGVDGGGGLACLAGLGHGHAWCAGQRVLGPRGTRGPWRPPPSW